MAINSNSAVNRGSGFLTVVGAVFAVVGSAAGVSTLRKAITGIVDVKQIVLGFSMALMFAGAGIGLIVWSRVSANLSARRNETMLQNPGKPWLWRDDWAQGYARSEWKSTATMMTIIGVAFLLFSVPMLMNFPASLRRAHPLQIAVVALFPLTGVLLIGQSLMAYLRSRKFREVRLTLSALPSTLGGKFQGRVQAQFVFPSSATVDLTLSCAFLRFRVRRQPQPLGADSVARSENCHCVERWTGKLHSSGIQYSLRCQRDGYPKCRGLSD